MARRMRLRKILLLVSALLLASPATVDAISCHRCFSAMGGCGHEVNWRMYPWRSCPGSEFCVKVIEKVGSEYKITRDCEKNLAESARHRLQMPMLRRHGYCLPARKNDPFNPLETIDSSTRYCFCNDWNGCNAASGIHAKFAPLLVFAALGYLGKLFL